MVKRRKKTRAKDVSPNINRTQAAEITPGSAGVVASAAAWRYLQPARSILSLPGVMGVYSVLSPVTLTFDLDVQTRPSEGRNTSSLWIWAQIRSAISEIFDSQTNEKQTNKKKSHSAKNRTLLACGNKPKSKENLNQHSSLRAAHVCIVSVVHNRARNCSDNNFPSYPPDNDRSSDDVYWNGAGICVPATNVTVRSQVSAQVQWYLQAISPRWKPRR